MFGVNNLFTENIEVSFMRSQAQHNEISIQTVDNVSTDKQ